MHDDPKNAHPASDVPEEAVNYEKHEDLRKENQPREKAEDLDVRHLDHRHVDPKLQTPDNLQHGDRFRPEGE